MLTASVCCPWVGYEDASYVGRRTGVSGHIIGVSLESGEAAEVLRLVTKVDPDARRIG
jgi:hypothetical protein